MQAVLLVAVEEQQAEPAIGRPAEMRLGPRDRVRQRRAGVAVTLLVLFLGGDVARQRQVVLDDAEPDRFAVLHDVDLAADLGQYRRADRRR